jgi:two-component system sensor histidine kinase KdpD
MTFLKNSGRRNKLTLLLQYDKKMMNIDKIRHLLIKSGYLQYLIAFSAVILTAIVCKPLSNLQSYHIVSFLLLFVVSIMAGFLNIGPVIFASTISALIWNYYFIPPHRTFHIASTEDQLMFISFFFIAFLNGILTNRIRQQERIAREREERTKAIYELTRDLSHANGLEEVLEISEKGVAKQFDAEILCVCFEKAKKPETLTTSKSKNELSLIRPDIVEWVLENNKPAGRYTDNLNDDSLTYFPLTGLKKRPGVIGLRFNRRLTKSNFTYWLAYIAQISNAVEHELLMELALKARLLDESDKLYKTLFASISHEFRIPIAAIMGASDTLLISKTSRENQKELISEILKASTRLNHLVENLLNMSRLESGKIAVHLDWCDINDLLNKVTKDLKEELGELNIVSSIPLDMPLVKLDFGLMEQVIHNLILNSCQHSVVQTEILFASKYEEGTLEIVIEDEGPGFPPELLDQVFNKFFRVKISKPGGLGLGLSIVKGLVEAHNGTIKVENKKKSGARFIITIPSEILDIKDVIVEE